MLFLKSLMLVHKGGLNKYLERKRKPHTYSAFKDGFLGNIRLNSVLLFLRIFFMV